MAIFHCPISIIKRSEGRSSVAAAAYRSGTKITNEYDGVTHDYTRKGGVVYSEIILPPHAPDEFSDRSILWNSVEMVEKARNAQLARELEVALPVELDREAQIELVRDFVRDTFVDKGMCADFSIHKELKARITRLYNWSKSQKEHESLTVAELWQAHMDSRPAPKSAKGRINMLHQNAAVFNFIMTNNIRSTDDLHTKIAAMNKEYYQLKGKIVAAEKRIAELTKRLEMIEQYEEYKSVRRKLDSLPPKKQAAYSEAHRAELVLFDAAAQYLEKLKTSGEAVTPKKWRNELSSLTVEKDALYLELRSMRDEIKTAETLRSATNKSERNEDIPQRDIVTR